MELKYEFVSMQELDSIDRALIALRGKDFYFLRRNGVIQINSSLANHEELTQIAKAMWQFDHLLNEDDSEKMDALWNQAERIAGADAADQLYSAWREALHEKLDAEDKEAAREWLSGINVPSEIDAICGITDDYEPGLIKAIWSESRSTDALFLFGYYAGLKAARMEV